MTSPSDAHNELERADFFLSILDSAASEQDTRERVGQVVVKYKERRHRRTVV